MSVGRIALAMGVTFCAACARGEPIDRVLLISIDTCRADRLGCYGFDGPVSPRLDALAAEGVLFRRALSPVPLTLPAHASMLTGTLPPDHGVRGNATYRLGPESVTLAEVLAGHGFATGAVVGAFVLDSRFGLDQGFDSYDDRFDEEISTNVIVERRGEEVTRHAVDWLDEHRDERFFLFLHYYDPHLLYEPPEPWASRFAGDPYAGEIAAVDAAIGTVLDELRRLGLYDSTLIVVTADHGEMLGEHGEPSHGWFLYESALRVPLIVRAPGLAARAIEEPVSLIDIVPTVCGLLGIPPPAAAHGADLTPALRGARTTGGERPLYCESLEPARYGCNPLLGLVEGSWKYIETTRPELYDLSSDPAETRDLIAREPARATELAARLDALLGQRSTAPAPLAPEERRRIEALGYVATGAAAGAGIEPGRADPKDRLDLHVETLGVTFLIGRGELGPARRRAEALVARQPDFGLGHLLLARIARQERRLDDAIRHYERALELDPDQPDVRTDLGATLAAAGRPAEATEAYRAALRLDPGNVEALNNLGSALLLEGRTDEAIEHFRRALEQRPDSADVERNLAIALLRQGDAEEAVEHFSRVVALRPDSPQAQCNLGTALRELGRTDDAAVHLAWCARRDPAPGEP